MQFIFLMILVKLIFLCFVLETFPFTPELVELQIKITELEALNSALAKKRYDKIGTVDDALDHNIEPYHFEQLILKEKCSFKGEPAQGFLFQTPSDIYMAINFKTENKTMFLNSECKVLSKLDNIRIQQILSDRGMVQTGIVYFITQEHQLYHTYEDNQFQNTLKLTTLKKETIAGGIIRYRGKDRVEIFVSYVDGTIQVYDESGNSKLMVFLQQNKSQISVVADHHPYPLFTTKSNWISMLDTSKFVQISQNCPHIPNIQYILSQNYYGQTIYILNTEKIYVMTFEISKKLCKIKRQYDLTSTITKINKVSFFSNTLFIDNKVFNMTSRKLSIRNDCPFKDSLEFISKRNQHDKDYCLKSCCQEDKCVVEFYQVKQIDKDKSIFIWLTISFIVVIFVSLSLMKKSSVANIDIDDNPYNVSEKRLNEISKKNREKNKHKKK